MLCAHTGGAVISAVRLQCDMKNSNIHKAKSTFFDSLISIYNLELEERGRRRLYVLFLLTIVIPLIPFAIYHFRIGNLNYAIINSIISLLIIIFILTLRRASLGLFHFRFVAVLFQAVMVYWAYMGAVNGYSTLLIMTYPPFVFFLLGRREGLLLSLSILFFTALFMINPGNINGGFDYSANYTVRHLLTLTILILFAYNYESVREHFKQGMFIEKKKLEEHRNNLEQIVAQRTGELEKSRDELAESEKRYRLLAHTVRDLIWAADMSLNFTYISPSVNGLFGMSVEEALNRPIAHWNTPESYEKFMNVYIDEMEHEKQRLPGDPDRDIIIELEQVRKDGTVFPVEIKMSFMRDADGKPIGIVGITRDITERKEAEADREMMRNQLAQAQKLEAVGTLVGGLAHDFNNILGAIVGSINLIQFYLQDETLSKRNEIFKYLDMATKSCNRSANIIKQLLMLSRKKEVNLIPLNIISSLKDILEICKNSFPKSVILDFHLPDSPLYVLAEPIQIEQVILNICINASHAMTSMRDEDEKEGGTLSVDIALVEADEYPDNVDFDRGGKWVRIRISDTGVGIPEEIRDRIFEPFFTTKKQGQGSGLGLATSYGIIKQHGGHIALASEVGAGTTFSIYLPYLDIDRQSEAHLNNTTEFTLGKDTVLIVDDELFILDVASGILKRFGYRTITSNKPSDAINIYRDSHDTIDVIICDLSMPGKSGIDVSKEILEINPAANIILSSGMIEEAIQQRALSIGIKEVLRKPYSARELLAVLNRVLHR